MSHISLGYKTVSCCLWAICSVGLYYIHHCLLHVSVVTPNMLPKLAALAPSWCEYFGGSQALEDLIVHLALGCEQGGTQILKFLLDAASPLDCSVIAAPNSATSASIKDTSREILGNNFWKEFCIIFVYINCVKLYLIMCLWVSIIKCFCLYMLSWGHFDAYLHTHMHTDLKGYVFDICIRLSAHGVGWL